MQTNFPLVNQSHLNKRISHLLTKVTSYIRLWFFISVSAWDEANKWCGWKLAQCLLNISLQLVHTSVQGEINRKSRWWYFPFFFLCNRVLCSGTDQSSRGVLRIYLMSLSVMCLGLPKKFLRHSFLFKYCGQTIYSELYCCFEESFFNLLRLLPEDLKLDFKMDRDVGMFLVYHCIRDDLNIFVV